MGLIGLCAEKWENSLSKQQIYFQNQRLLINVLNAFLASILVNKAVCP
jgi:hypothetical protein